MKQYSFSPRLQALRTNWAENFEPSAWIDQFYSKMWNVDTAVGVGLDWWGRIVNVPNGRLVKTGNSDPFGFSPSWETFGHGTFYTGPTATSTFYLADRAYRVLILTKAQANIADTTIPGLNRVLQQLFPDRGSCWVNDLGGMSIRYVFEFSLEGWERSVLTAGGVMPRPAGVYATIAEIPESTFGFRTSGDYQSYQPFGQGTFLSTGAVSNVA